MYFLFLFLFFPYQFLQSNSFSSFRSSLSNQFSILLVCHFLMKVKKRYFTFVLDKCLYVDFSRLSLKKIVRINIYPLIKTLWPDFSFAPCRTNHVRLSALRIADKKRELALSTHRTYHTDHQYILALNFHNNETAYDQYAHTRHPARPYDCHPHR